MHRSVRIASRYRLLVSSHKCLYSTAFEAIPRPDAEISHPDPIHDSPSAALVEQHAPYVVTTYSRPPLVLTRGQGCYIWDIENRYCCCMSICNKLLIGARKFVDFMAGIAVNALGHSDPGVCQVISEQSQQLIHSSNLYHNPWTGELARLLVERTKLEGSMQGVSKVFFSNSGTEANEAAIKFARKVGKYRGGNKSKTGFVAFNNGFHGRTMGALSATCNPKYQAPFAPMVPGFKYGDINNIEQLESLISEDICGVIIEPIQGEGGVFECSEDYLRALKKRCDAVGAVLIYDEIQVR